MCAALNFIVTKARSYVIYYIIAVNVSKINPYFYNYKETNQRSNRKSDKRVGPTKKLKNYV